MKKWKRERDFSLLFAAVTDEK